MFATQQSRAKSDAAAASTPPDATTTSDPGWAWSEYQPDDKRPWTLPLVGHLLRRAAFGASWSECQQALEAGPRRTIDLLVRPQGDVAGWERTMSQDEVAVSRASGIETMRAWWLRRMLLTPHPLLEKMTLFWHSHFGVSNARVNDPQLMLQHVQTLREHALGSYRAMLEAAAQDPAVLLNAGAERSPKSQPNENFIRQLMQQYSVGPGHYGDEDVREAARAFTGWAVMGGELRFLAHEHDEGSKKVLGNQGEWEPKDIVRIVLQQPATPRLVARKLYNWLVSEVDQPSDALLDPLAEMLARNYDVGEVVETILRSNHFFSPAAYRRRIKSPGEYGLGMAAALGVDVPTAPLGADLAEMGQGLYAPPTNSGWVGGRHWINGATMIARQKLAHAMFTGKGAYGDKLNVAEFARQHGCATAREAADLLLRVFVQDDVTSEVRKVLLTAVPESPVMQSADWLRDFAVQVVVLPESQLC
jgi:uncharacterized protein (DUF1800 family)